MVAEEPRMNPRINSRINLECLSQLMAEWDEQAEAVGGGNPAALRGSGTTTFLRGGATEVYVRALVAEVEFVARTLRVEPGESVLEVACGNCVFLAHLAAGCRVAVGMDLSRMMLHRGAEYLERTGASAGSHLLQGAMQLLPLRSASFDKVLANFCLHLLPPAELPTVLGELARVKTPGGMVLLGALPLRSCLSGRREQAIHLLRNLKRRWDGRPRVLYSRFTLPQLRGLLASSGLKVVDEGTSKYNFYPLPRAVRPRLRERYEGSRRFSYLFSSNYYFLCQ